MNPSFHQLHSQLLNFFWDYFPVPCSLILEEDHGFWFPVSMPQRRTHASYFELYFGRRQERWDFNKRCFAKARRERKAVLGEHAGMQDLFVPVKAKGKVAGYMVLGSFQEEMPGRDLLWSQWKKLRRSPTATDAEDFALYVQARLETPVLDKSLRQPLAGMLELAGAALLGLAPAGQAAERMDKVKRSQVARRSSWRMWHYTESRRVRFNFNQGPFEDVELAPWDAEEFGLKRSPDCAVAFAPAQAGPDQAGAMAAVARLQQELFELCRERPGLVAGRSGLQAGLVLAAFAKPPQALQLARELQQALARRLGSPVLASVASQPGRPARIQAVIAAAEQGLRLAAARGLALVEAGAGAEGAASAPLPALSRELASALAEGRAVEAGLAQTRLAEAAVLASAGRLDLLRLQLHWSLAPLLEKVERREGLASGSLWREAGAELERTNAVAELVQAFRQACAGLAARLQRPGSAAAGSALRRALQALQERPEEGVGLGAAARDLGLSPSRLSRLMKKASGTPYVQARTQARLDKARRLLRESGLSLAQVTMECGWQAQAYFSRVFRDAEGLSPSAYRKKHQRLSLN